MAAGSPPTDRLPSGRASPAREKSLSRSPGQIATPFFPAGLAYGRTPLGDRLYVVNNLSGPAGGTNPPGHTVTVDSNGNATLTIPARDSVGFDRADLVRAGH